ncbi:MAG: right-handed parallel beta-helix repeat-containing protein, partial [Bacteroidales bacterium]|nr:right-handed parallel beta-helix repeat-containing protein [Bacteroidales bacterium]
MKRIIYFFSLWIIPAGLFSQPQNGDGTSGNPYSGTITTPWTLSGDKYCGNLEVSDGTFTISPGAVLRFGSGNSLTISGTGVLLAAGTSGSPITFTASGTSWGHIVYSSSGSTSTIENCIIEKGYDATYGGGLYITSSNIVVKSSIFRSNKSPRGGGISVLYASPSISKCYFYSNWATVDGGGIFTWGSAALIENCIFYSNTANSNGGGGYFGNADNLVVVNSTFASNNTNSAGKAITFNYNINPVSPVVIKNSIVWGADESASIKYFGKISKSASIFVNCAIQGYTSGYTNCIGLNSDNTASDGPNFINPGPSGTINLSLAFVSPCRDKGTSSGAPATDYAGNTRIGPVDIGAYEILYSRWKGGISGEETVWSVSGNWEAGLLPGSSSNTVVPDVTHDPVISSEITLGYLETETGGNLTIDSDGFLTVPKLLNNGSTIFSPGAKGTINDITNNGTFRLESDETGIASLILDSYSGNDAEYELYLSGGGSEALDDYKWHYISSPVTSLSTEIFTTVTWDLAQYVESKPFLSLLQGWVAFDGYVYSTGLSDGPTFNTLIPGKGYNFWDDKDNTFVFSGTPNTSGITIPLEYTEIPSMHGFNLLGNPYSSGLNWDDIVNEVYNPYPANTSKGLYFTRNNEQCSYIGGVGNPSDVTGIIPPMQGFFIKTYSTGNSITIPAESRTHDNIHARYKGQTAIPLIRIKLNEDPFYHDETVVRFDVNAKTTCDYDFDAVKMFASETKTYIYSTMEGVNYAINGQP